MPLICDKYYIDIPYLCMGRGHADKMTYKMQEGIIISNETLWKYVMSVSKYINVFNKESLFVK